MSATNTTTNYNLPIFLSSDKPAWLVDFNGAMTAIDAQMKNNADAIALKSPILTFSDTTDIDFTVTSNTVEASLTSGVAGTISRALTKPISSPVSEQFPYVDTSNAQQMATLGTGLTLDNGALNAIDLNLTSITTFTASDVTCETANHTISSLNITVATNAAKTIGKIYGDVVITNSSSSGTVASIKLNTLTLNVTSGFTIYPAGFSWRNQSVANLTNNSSVYITIGNDGSIRLNVGTFGNATTVGLYFPTLYFFKDFGDTP